MTLELDPDFIYAHSGLSDCYLMKGMHRETVAAMEKACELAGWETSHALTFRGFVYASVGRVVEARRLLEALLERSGSEYVSGFEVAKIYLALGDNDRAIEWLEKAYEQRDGNMLHLTVLPGFEQLGADARFKDLTRRMNLVPAVLP